MTSKELAFETGVNCSELFHKEPRYWSCQACVGLAIELTRRQPTSKAVAEEREGCAREATPERYPEQIAVAIRARR